jgi:hypothetical protein
MKRSFELVAFLVSSLALAACGAGAPVPKGGDGAPNSTAAATTAPEGDAAEGASGSPAAGATASSASETKPEVKKSKIEQCADVGNSMQLGQKVGPIANVNDGPKLRQMAGELRKGASALGAVGVSPGGLMRIRGDYADTMGGMAEALEAAADSKESAGQKAAIERFRKLEPKLNELIGELNGFCNAPGNK